MGIYSLSNYISFGRSDQHLEQGVVHTCQRGHNSFIFHKIHLFYSFTDRIGDIGPSESQLHGYDNLDKKHILHPCNTYIVTNIMIEAGRDTAQW